MASVNPIGAGLRFVLEAGHQAPSADNSQPWCFQVGHERLGLAYDRARVGSSILGPDHVVTVLSMGAVIENLIQAASTAGLTLEREPDAGAPDPAVYFRARIGGDHRGRVPDRAHPIFRRHTNRFGYRPDPLPAASLQACAALREQAARLVVLTDPGAVGQLAGYVKTASQARFQTPELHDWLMGSLRFTAAEADRGDGLDVRTLDLPPGGAGLLRALSDWRRMQALNRFGGYRLLAAIEGALVRKSPCLIAVVGGRGRRDVLDAGQLMERVWLLLTADGVAAHPYYVLSDQVTRLAEGKVLPHMRGPVERASAGLRERLGLGPGEEMHMLLRVGLPRRDPPRSRRLPLDQVICAS